MVRSRGFVPLFSAFLSIASAGSAAWADCSNSLSETSVARPHVIVLSAPSGAGKTTLANLLLEKFPNLEVSISSTTRAPRGQEQNGKDYHFLAIEDFKARASRGEFAEFAEVHGNFYGTQIATLREAMARGHSVLALIDVQGAAQMRKSLPNDLFTIFIQPPSLEILEQRLRGRRTDSEEKIQLRLHNAREEMKRAPEYNQVVTNDALETAVSDLARILRENRLVP